MRYFLPFLLLLICISADAQKIYGTVFNDKGDLLPFASVTIKGTSKGATANDKANFSFFLAKGNYTVVCQHIGYAATEKNITVDGDVEVTFILKQQKLILKEVVVKTDREDPAYEIIRHAIAKRQFYNKQVEGFHCDLYNKDLIKFRKLPNKIFGKKIEDADKKEMGLDSAGKGIVYLSESISKIHAKQPDKFKMEVISSRVSGSNSYGFTFPVFINLYTNNVNVFSEALNQRGFVSPIADGAISFYRFKFLGTFWEDGKAINSIRVTPRRKYEPLFSGIINITDEDWRIHSFDLLLTKTSQLEILDSLQISQLHVPVGNEIWRVKNQVLYFNIKMFGIDLLGNFLAVYSNYEINPVFEKKFFDRIVIKYDTAVNKRTHDYWDTIRPVPLEREEQRDYQKKDSIFLSQRDSFNSRMSIDSLRKRQGKLKLYKVGWTNINRTHYSRMHSYNWGIESLFKNSAYNTVEGINITLAGYFEKWILKRKTRLLIEPTLRYGFDNTHFNPSVNIQFRKNRRMLDDNLNRSSWGVAGGKRVSQFNSDNPITPLLNSFTTLVYGNNYMKIYENYFGKIYLSRSYESGLRFTANLLYEDRIPLNNSTDYTFSKKDTIQLTPNYPYEQLNEQFDPHQAVIASFEISIKPGQKYIQFPHYKVSMGSKLPTFSLAYAKGIENLFGSDVNFDKWKLTVTDERNLKLAGSLKYKLSIGGFLNRKQVFIQDYQHFNGNQTRVASEYLNSFQVAKYYANSTTASFYSLGHLEHHLNGLVTNKIPLFNRLNWNLVIGSNAFYVNSENNYFEIFAGLENIFKVLRIDFVGAYENGTQGLSGIRLGAGGLLGGQIKEDSGNGRDERSMSISF